MSIFKEITKEIQNKSKHNEMIKSATKLEEHYYSLAGNADYKDINVREVSQMLITIRTELNQENKLRLKETKGMNSFMDSDYNYSNASSYDLAPYPLMARFLNTLDKDGEALKPLLEKLKSNSGEELADIIFKEIVPIHQKWVETYQGADPHLKLQLNHVDVDEIEALKNFENVRIFKAIINDGISRHKYLFKPESYTKPANDFDFNRTKYDIADDIFKEYELDIVMKIEIADGLHIFSNGDEFFNVGISSEDKFIFQKLDREIPINGYIIDFSDTKGNAEKSSEVKTLLHMVFIGSVETLETKGLADNEAVIFSMKYLQQKSTNLKNENSGRLTYDESMYILNSLGADEKNEFNKNFEFSDTAKKAINDFAGKIRPDQMESPNHLTIINMLHTIGADKADTNHLDLWCLLTDERKHSPLVKTVSSLVDDYRYDKKETKELLAIAKKLDNEGLLLLESKLHCYGIDPVKFQKELSKPEIKVKKYKM